MKSTDIEKIHKHMANPIHPPSSISHIEIADGYDYLIKDKKLLKKSILDMNPCRYYIDPNGNVKYVYANIEKCIICLASYDKETTTLYIEDIQSLSISGVSTC